MSSKQKKNFDYDKKIPKSKNPSESIEDMKEHKAIKNNIQEDPIELPNKNLPSINNNNETVDEKKVDECINNQGETFSLTQIEQKNVNKQENLNPENEIKEENEPKFYSEKEEYLKSKLNQMNVSESILKGVTKGINKTHLHIQDEISKNNLVLQEHAQAITDILEKSLHLSKVNTSNDVYSKYSPEMIAYLKHLKQDEENIAMNIAKLEQNQKLLENESVRGIKNSIIETNIRNTQIKSLKDKKETLMEKLKNISMQIDSIINSDKPDKKGIIRDFLANFEKDKEILEEKSKLYEEQRNKIKQKIYNDLNMSREKRDKEFEKKIEEEEIKKKELIQERIKTERDILIKRKQEIDEKLQKTKECIYKKLDKSKEDYLYFQKQQKFLQEENQLNIKVKLIKKDPLVSKEELEELAAKIKEHQEMTNQQAKENANLRKEMWKNRSQVLPRYKSPVLQIIENEELQKEEERKKTIERKELMSNEVKHLIETKIPVPKIDPELKKKRENQNIKMDKNLIMKIRNKNKQKQFLIEIPKPKVHKKSKLSIVEAIDNNNYINNTELNSYLSKKPKRFGAPKHALHPRPDKPIDYLADIRKSREKSPRKIVQFNVNEYLSTDKNDNLIEGIQLAKSQTDILDTKVNKKKELMMANGGYSKNPELGNEIGNMLVDSIHAKLDILNAINVKKN